MAQEEGVNLQDVRGSGPGGRITRKDVEAQLSQAAVTGKVNAVPAARRLAGELSVDLRQVEGSGPGGRVQSADVQAAARAVQQRAAVTVPAGETAVLRKIPMTGMRRTIARRLQKSAQEAPHITFDIEVEMTALQALRERANKEIKDGQKRVSITAILSKATAWALMRNPLLNAWLIGNEQEQEIVVLAQVNMGIAVALEEGLIVPVVRDAASKGILQLSDEINNLAERARNNRLLPDEVAEGTFTISNLGMFGIDRFDAIINPPQVAILAISRVRKQVLADEADNLVVRPVTTMTLSADHRAVDGAIAARFMSDLREALEHPEITTL